MAEEESRARNRSFLWPLLLIAFGVFLLMDNAGILPRGSWEVLWRFWPVFLILAGADMVLRALGSGRLAQVARLVVMAFLVATAFLMAALHDRFPVTRELGQSVSTKHRSIRVPRRGAAEAALRVDWDQHPGRIEALHGSANLMEADLAYRGELDYDLSRGDERVEILLDSRMHVSGLRPFHWILDDGPGRWRIALGREVDLELDLESGRGGLIADLSGLRVRVLHLESGSGRVDLTLPAGGELSGSLDTGSGSVTLRLPEGLGLRLERRGGSGGFEPGQALRRVEADSDGTAEVWETEGFEASVDRARLKLDQGSGRVRVR